MLPSPEDSLVLNLTDPKNSLINYVFLLLVSGDSERRETLTTLKLVRHRGSEK